MTLDATPGLIRSAGVGMPRPAAAPQPPAAPRDTFVVRRRPTDPRLDLRLADGVPDHLLPNLMIAGVTHAGATELARCLGRHEEIKRPVVKRIDRYDPMRYDRPVEGSLADYDRYFANWTGQRFRLERSPTYFDGGRDLVRAVARDLPDLRVLIVLRDPTARLWAGFRDKIATGRLPRAMTYPAYVERCLALRANGAERFEGNRYFRTLSTGLYAEHLGPWLELFGQRLRIVFAEDLDRAPTAVLDGVYRWLGLEPIGRQLLAGMDLRAGAGSADTGLQTFDSPPERGFRSLRSGMLRASAGAGRDLLRRIPHPTSRRATDCPRTRVDQLYRRANHDLADLLRAADHRDLPAWVTR